MVTGSVGGTGGEGEQAGGWAWWCGGSDPSLLLLPSMLLPLSRHQSLICECKALRVSARSAHCRCALHIASMLSTLAMCCTVYARMHVVCVGVRVVVWRLWTGACIVYGT